MVFLDQDRMMDNVQKHNISANVPLSQTFRSHFHKLDLVAVQEARWHRGVTKAASEYTFFYGKGNENHELGTGFFYIRESYQQLRGYSLSVIGCHK
jgi:hypothetical protein